VLGITNETLRATSAFGLERRVARVRSAKMELGMTGPTIWWKGNVRERFWLESTDRRDIGADLRAPLSDESGSDNWRYTLFREAEVGDLVFHYDKRLAAIASVSRIAGAPTPAPIVWAARGSYARDRGAELAELPGYRMSLDHHQALVEPVTLDSLRAAAPSIRALHDALRSRLGGPLSLSIRTVRPTDPTAPGIRLQAAGRLC
jgi:hypothetical protein